MYLPVKRYTEIKHEVSFMFEECGVNEFPINCFLIAKKLYYKLIPYSALLDWQLRLALQFDPDGFSTIHKNPETGMYEFYIFYNDFGAYKRQRWTIFHEIGHIYLGHFENDALTDDEKEAEANFFAKYSIAPPPLINVLDCNSPKDVADFFDVSGEASIYIYDYYLKWKNFGPIEYEPFEVQILEQFSVA